MDTQMERDCNRIIQLGMQQMRMLFAENEIAKAKNEGELSDRQYDTFRAIADKHWDKWSRRVNRLNKQVKKGRD